MYRVEVKNPCKCFFKSGFPEVQRFSDKEEAKEEAERMLSHMQNNFCHKHEFSLTESFGNQTIFIRPRSK